MRAYDRFGRSLRVRAAAVVVASAAATATLSMGGVASGSAATGAVGAASGAGGILYGVSCPSATDCVAVGNYYSGTSPQGGTLTHVLADSWNGKSWTNAPVPLPAGADDSTLQGVSCTSTSACLAVGSWETKAETGGLLAEWWSGKAWSLVPTPATSYPSIWFSSVSCTSATACMAVGSNLGARDTNKSPLAASWNGKSWTVLSVPAPAAAISSDLLGVSCVSSSACEAVGDWYNPEEPLAESWNGKTWTLEHLTSAKAGYGAVLAGVSCTTSTACSAVGMLGAGSSTDEPAATTWNGKGWSAISDSTTKDAGNLFYGVSCTSATSCVATGSGLTGSWNGKTWTVRKLSAPAASTFPELNGVARLAGSDMMAVGEYATSTGGSTLAEQWNGSSWTMLPTPPA